MLFTFCLSSILFKNCEICFTHGLDLSKPCFVLISYCSIFNDRLLRFSTGFSPLLRSLGIIPLSFPFVNTFLKNFFDFLKKFRFFGDWQYGQWKSVYERGRNHLKRRSFLPLSRSPHPPWLRRDLMQRVLSQKFSCGRAETISNAEVSCPSRALPDLLG